MALRHTSHVLLVVDDLGLRAKQCISLLVLLNFDTTCTTLASGAACS